MGNKHGIDKESYNDLKEDLENVAWFFKEHSVDKKLYKSWYEADEKANNIVSDESGGKYKELLPSFQEISEEMERIIQQQKPKKTKTPIDDYYWDDKYYDYINTTNSEIQYYYLCILHYKFMRLILRKLFYCNFLKNKNPTEFLGKKKQ
jgi:hypothetical protein